LIGSEGAGGGVDGVGAHASRGALVDGVEVLGGGVDGEGRIKIEIHVEGKGKVQCKVKRGGVEFRICGLGLKGVVTVPET